MVRADFARSGRARDGSRPGHLTNGSLNALLVTVPVAPLALAVACAHRGWGLLNQIPVSLPVAVAIAVVALDGLGYLQHRMLHGSSILWRVHRVHHADVDLDATTATGLRFHLPAESERNFATIFSVWDRFASTYEAHTGGHESRRAGLQEFREPRYLTLPWTLALPFCASPPVPMPK